ncbi:MAG TPA: pyridoxamine 5'-phosphate oxidase family protein, partial [Bacillota bacterium]|nr:pyridoxamine 5'-phosphate oxidase family protein [Bacillota bacterium]
HNTLVLATVSEGFPASAPLFYASRGFDLYFLSDPSTRHGQNLQANPSLAATITEDYAKWQDIRGIQLEGTAQLVIKPLEKAAGMAVYLGKFPFVSDFLKSADFRNGAAKAELYRIIPRVIWYIDNSQGFSHREKLVL